MTEPILKPHKNSKTKTPYRRHKYSKQADLYLVTFRKLNLCLK